MSGFNRWNLVPRTTSLCGIAVLSPGKSSRKRAAFCFRHCVLVCAKSHHIGNRKWWRCHVCREWKWGSDCDPLWTPGTASWSPDDKAGHHQGRSMCKGCAGAWGPEIRVPSTFLRKGKPLTGTVACDGAGLTSYLVIREKSDDFILTAVGNHWRVLLETKASYGKGWSWEMGGRRT